MPTLGRHLRSVDHGALPFRADCPICRSERLDGAIPTSLAAPRRAVAAGLAVAIAGFAPATAGAASTQPKINLPANPGGQTSGGEEGDGDAGGDEAQPGTPADAPSTPADTASPAQDSSAPTATPPPTAAPASSPPAAPSPPAAAPTTPPPAAPSPPQAAPTTPPAAESSPPPAESSPPPAEPSRPPPESSPAPSPETTPPAVAGPERLDEAQTHARAHASHPRRARPASATPHPRTQPRAPSPAALTARAAPEHASASRTTDRTGRIHVVGPGESLWSIARGLLGPAASDARMALLVSHLWRLNADHIASGRPDLISVGLVLRLPTNLDTTKEN